MSPIADTMPATMTHMQSQTQLSAFLAGAEVFSGMRKKSRLLGRSRLSFTNEVERRWLSYGLVSQKLSQLIVDLFEQLSESTFTKYRELLTQAIKV